MRYVGEKIWIIGASSGIGEALAKELSARGARLLLSARSEKRLTQLANQLGEKHGVLPVDFAELDKIPGWVDQAAEHFGSIDRVIFLAALYEPTSIENMDVSILPSMFQVNVSAAMALSQAVLPYLQGKYAERENLEESERVDTKGLRGEGLRRGGAKSVGEKIVGEKTGDENRAGGKRGQLVITASVAGWLGLPNAQPYGATKAALINFTQSLYAEVGDRIDIKLINPGFVATPLTDKNRFTMPCCLSAEEAAERIADRLQRREFEITFPKRFTFMVKVLAGLPNGLKLLLTRKMHERRSDLA